MTHLVHDYTLPAEASKKLYEAYTRCQDAALKECIGEIREILDKYLAQDNLVEVED